MKNRIGANIVAMAIAFVLMPCESIAATLAEMRQYYNKWRRVSNCKFHAKFSGIV